MFRFPLALMLVCCGPRGEDAPSTSPSGGVPDPEGEEDPSEPEPSDPPTSDPPDSGAPPPSGLGSGLLIYEGDGAMPHDSGPNLIDGIDDLIALYDGLGVEVTVSATWPADPSPYGLVFVFLPGTAPGGSGPIPAATLDALEAWLDRGGRLLLAGDVNTQYQGYDLEAGNDVIDGALEAWGVPIALNADVSGDAPCAGTSDHPLLANAAVDWYAENDLEVAGPAEWLYCDALALYTRPCGEVVVSGDINPFSDFPEFAPELLRNLATVPVHCAP